MLFVILVDIASWPFKKICFVLLLKRCFVSFCACLKMFAMLLRPRKDHKFRFVWNIYHHGVGYSILILGIINVFKGLSILNPKHTYKTAYIAVIGTLGGITLLLEVVTWVIVLKRKSAKSTKPLKA